MIVVRTPKNVFPGFLTLVLTQLSCQELTSFLTCIRGEEAKNEPQENLLGIKPTTIMPRVRYTSH